jgi:protocatechuate 3,4-dioxygenase beta subunit
MPERSQTPKLTPRDWTTQPPYLDPNGYRSTTLRGPTKPMIPIRESLRQLSAPVYGQERVGELDADLTRNARVNGEPIGERMIITGRVMDERGRPARNQLVEIWQANSTGRYVHKVDQHDAPLDPNFLGAGRCLTDNDGRYRFMTIKPGAYPWGNHHNAWRPQHIHFSLFGDHFASRLVTQVYFPGDPLMEYDPILKATPEHARHLLVAKFSLDITEPSFALGYEWDIVLRGPNQTPMEA